MNEIIKKNGITFGIISGIISIVTTTLIYVINIKLFVSPWLGLLGIGISIILAVVLLFKTKKELLGNLSFKEAFTTYFIMASIAILMSTTFGIILFNFIDPSLKESIKELTLKTVSETMKKLGTSDSDISKTLNTIKKTDQFSIFQQIKGIFSSIVVSSIFGLILAAFFKSPTRQEV